MNIQFQGAYTRKRIGKPVKIRYEPITVSRDNAHQATENIREGGPRRICKSGDLP